MHSLAVKAVSLFTMRGVLDNFLCSARFQGVCLTSSCEQQGNKFFLCVYLDCIPFLLLIWQRFGGAGGHSWVEAEELVQVMMEKGSQWFAGGPLQWGCISGSINCMLTHLAGGMLSR